MMMKNKTLAEWAEENSDINPFENCTNIDNLGGAILYWEEMLYRYSERELFNENRFVATIERLFNYNGYKYKRLLQTTTATYDMFSNYKLQKEGTETNTLNISDNHTGTDTRTPNLTKTRTPDLTEVKTSTPGVSETTTETPTIKTKETITPTVKTRQTETPTVKTKETDVKGTTTTTTTTPEGYIDELSRTTYDSTNYNAVQKNVHSVSSNATTTVTPSGTGDTKTTEVLSGNTITDNEVVSGNTITEFEAVSGNNITVKTKTGNDTTNTTNTGTEKITDTGTETTQYNNTKAKTGTDALSFTNRIDSGYMYREPQNAIKDERDIAVFAILDVVLSDVERATLLSIYLY